MNGDVGMHLVKNCDNKKLLSNPIKDTSTIILHIAIQQMVMHDCASILDRIAKGTFCFQNVSHAYSASGIPYIAIHSVEYFLHLFHICFE